MNIRKLLLVIAIVSAIVVALSHSVSLFGGQHTWYNLGPEGSNIPCSKCHADICEELSVSGVHRDLDSGRNEACAACHRCNLTGYTYASGEGAGSTPGKEAHAASTVPCMECHEIGTWSPYAGGFTNKTNSPYHYNSSDYPGTKAAHNVFVQGAVNEILMEDSNEACIQCHTNASVNITYHIPQGYEIELNRTCDWKVDFSYYNFTDVVVSG